MLGGFQWVHNLEMAEAGVWWGGGGAASLFRGTTVPSASQRALCPKRRAPQLRPVIQSAAQAPAEPRVQGITGPLWTHRMKPTYDRNPEGPRQPLMLGSTARTLSEHDGVITGLTVTLTKRTPPHVI